MYPRLWICPECKAKNLEWPDGGVTCECGYVSKPEKQDCLDKGAGD